MCLSLVSLSESNVQHRCGFLPSCQRGGCRNHRMGRYLWWPSFISLIMCYLSLTFLAAGGDSLRQQDTSISTEAISDAKDRSSTRQMTPTAPPAKVAKKNCTLTIHPTYVTNLKVGNSKWINVNYSCLSRSNDPFRGKGTYTVRVFTTNKVVATPSEERHHYFHRPYFEKCSIGPICAAHTYLPSMHTGFYVGSNQVGRIHFIIEVSWWNTTKPSTIFNRAARKLPQRIGLEQIYLPISTLRHRKMVDLGFEVSVAFIACMTAISAGCMTEISFLRRNVRRPRALILAICSQHILMPGLIFGTLVGVGISKESSFGLFAASTVPGGGLAHLTVYLMGGDRELSTAISFANEFLVIVMAPAWLFAFTRYFTMQVNYGFFVLWLLPTLASYLLGFALRSCRPAAADAVMTWFTRPLLLLSGILLSTLGVYINHYAFDYIDYRLVLMALFLVFGGFLIGGLLGLLGQVGKPRRKTLAAETSVFNCLLVIVALRYALKQPDADLASSAPLWGCFFTPAPIILYFISHKIKAWTLHFIEKRKEKQYRHYSIVSSFAKMAEEVTAVSAPLALDGPSNELPPPPRPPSCDQKITSL